MSREFLYSEVIRDQTTLRDLERDLQEFETQYGLNSDEFFLRWQKGELEDSADFMDWSVIYKMAQECSSTTSRNTL